MGQPEMAGVGCQGHTWGTAQPCGAAAGRLQQHVASVLGQFVKGSESLLSLRCSGGAKQPFFFNYFFFSNIGNCQMLQEGENPACVRAVELLPRTPWAQQEQLVVLSPATTPRRWLSCVTELQGQGHGDQAGLCKAERGLGKVSVSYSCALSGDAGFWPRVGGN